MPSVPLQQHVLLGVWMLYCCSPLIANTVSECNEAALRSALTAGGTVNFGCDGTIGITSTILITNDVVLDGTGRNVTISGGNRTRIFQINTGVSFTIINLTIASGRSSKGAGILNDQGTLVLNSVIFRNHYAYGADAQPPLPAQGSALFNQGGSIQAIYCTFSSNIAQANLGSAGLPADGQGTALFNEGGAVQLRESIFYSNQALGSRGYANIGAGPGSAALGGAIFNTGFLVAELCHFSGNRAQGGNGGSAGGMPPGSGGHSGGSGGDALGGAIYNSGDAYVYNCTFETNSLLGGNGGAGTAGTGYFSLPGGTGGSGGKGGNALGAAIYNSSRTRILASTFFGNAAEGGNGGVAGSGGGGGTGGTGGVGGEGGQASGGGLCDILGASVTNCTFASNSITGGNGTRGGDGGAGTLVFGSVGGDGGPGGNGGNALGAAVFCSGLSIVVNCTIAGNNPHGGVGAIGGSGGCGRAGCGAPGTNGVAGLAASCSGAKDSEYSLHLVNTLISAPIGRGA